MQTIEERADAYVGHPEEIDEFTSETIKRKAYIAGAKEQKAIDIERACEWLKNNWREYVNQDRDGMILFGHWESDFRKAMGE